MRENSFEKRIGTIIGIPVAVLSMTVAETFLDPAIQTVNDKVAAIEKSISQYAKDSNLTSAEQRTLAQTLVHHLDAVLKEIPGPALSISRLAEAAKDYIKYVLKGALATRDYGRELGQNFAERMGQGNRVQNFLSRVGGVSGMTIGLGLSVMDKGKGGKSEKPSMKSLIKAEQLPTQGKVRFVPNKDQHPTVPLQRGPNNGFYDKFKNEWTVGSSRTKGESFEWDVILSRTGKEHFGWATRDGSHLNVSLKGRITHK